MQISVQVSRTNVKAGQADTTTSEQRKTGKLRRQTKKAYAKIRQNRREMTEQVVKADRCRNKQAEKRQISIDNQNERTNVKLK